MQATGEPWSPRLGDFVQVSVTGDIGEVVEITGSGDARWFIIAISPRPAPGDVPTASAVKRRSCTLGEQAPARMP